MIDWGHYRAVRLHEDEPASVKTLNKDWTISADSKDEILMKLAALLDECEAADADT